MALVLLEQEVLDGAQMDGLLGKAIVADSLADRPQTEEWSISPDIDDALDGGSMAMPSDD